MANVSCKKSCHTKYLIMDWYQSQYQHQIIFTLWFEILFCLENMFNLQLGISI